MVCPRCGGDVLAAADRCPRCAATLAQNVATGVLTPPPVPGDLPTSFIDGGEGLTRQLTPPRTIESEPETSRGDDATRVTYRTGAPARPLRPQNDDEEATILPGAGSGQTGSGPLTPGQVFGSRYHIIRALGVGGMGAVYQAWDAELGVAVAMKVIRPDVMADPTMAAEVERRFKRELVLAREVTHKNVVRIHDLGEIGGIKYITMTYVDGQDLSTMLKREGTLLVPTVLRIARAVVAGLVEAHKVGVVHRDLKPANIMIDKAGDALIMDFGIARSAGGPKQIAPAAPAALPKGVRHTSVSAEATQYGAVMGTVEYMAPEQAQGRDVDQRADVYALGLMFYDMLVGRQRRAQSTQSAIAELQARMAKPPPPLKTIIAEIPEALDRLIGRCIEPDPEKRYQTSQELADDLSRLDGHGVPIPEQRRYPPILIAAAVAVVAVLVTGTWWFTRTPPLQKQHEPVAVVIADFQNTTGDPTFDHTLEQTLRRALEGAGFITAYDRSRIRPALGVPAPDKLDEVAARELAVKQGLGVVVSGSIASRGNGYDIAVKAGQTATGKAIANVQARASSKEQVLASVTSLATTVRKSLGDQTTGSAQLLGMKGLSTASLKAVSHYATAVDLQSKGKYDEARRSFLLAIQVDEEFGLAYQGLAAASLSAGRLQDAEKYAKDALRFVDRMTERERFAARGSYYRMTGDYQQCAKEYSDLIALYKADTVALNNLGVCRAKMRDMAGAVEALRQAVQILPNRVTYRANLALFADYAGDFGAAQGEVEGLQNPDAHGIAALALSQVGQGRLQDAAATYAKLATMDAWGTSFSASGLGDLALYDGRFAEAVRIFEQGAAADLAAKHPDSAATKFASAGYARLLAGQMPAAIAAADKAVATSSSAPIRFLAARIFAEAGAVAKAATLAQGLASDLAAEPQAYGKIVEGEIALKKGNAREAVKILTDANAIIDTWMGHFDLGRAYLELGDFPKADSAFDRCLKRRGEALSLLDEDPTYGYVPPVYYYLGRAREGLKTANFADSYREYIKIRGSSNEDPLLKDVRRRAGD
jgi:serine/threonine protein kinase/tetratricopeptide (TPR) repeat protein